MSTVSDKYSIEQHGNQGIEELWWQQIPCEKSQGTGRNINFFAKRNDIRPSNLSSEEKQLQSSLDIGDLVEIQPSCSANSQSTILLVFQDGGKLNAEIRWVLKHVVGGYSDNSVTGSVNLFQSMFPDGKIASIMELGKDKLKYVVSNGIALYFTQLLREQVSSSKWFVISVL